MSASDAVKEFCADAIKIRACDLRRDPQTRGDFQRAERHDAKRHAGGDDLCGKSGVEILCGETESCSQRVAILSAVANLVEDWIFLLHSAEDALFAVLRRRETDGDGADAEVEGDLLCAAQDRMVAVKPTCGAKGRVAGEGDLFGGEEDANLHAALALDLGSAREDEGRLAEVGFAGEGLHLGGREAAGIGEDSESIAFKGVLGEDIDLRDVINTVSRLGGSG